MYKLVRWAYELGVKNERRRIKDGLLVKLGDKPTENDFAYFHKEEAKKRLGREQESWYRARNIIENYFHPTMNHIDLGPTVFDEDQS